MALSHDGEQMEMELPIADLEEDLGITESFNKGRPSASMSIAAAPARCPSNQDSIERTRGSMSLVLAG